MKRVHSIVFDEEERGDILAALGSYSDTRARAHCEKLRAPSDRASAYDSAALAELSILLTTLRGYVEPGTSEDWWRAQGAWGHHDAINGLAVGARTKIDAIDRAGHLVGNAMAAVLAP